MKRFRFLVSDQMCDVYEPDAPTALGRCAVYLLGMPATLGATPITDQLVKAGYHVLQPHYPGTYDSAGFFSPTKSIEAIQHLIGAATSAPVIDLKSQKSKSLPSRLDVCVGQSFGAFVALRVAASTKSIEDLLLFSPAITYGQGATSCGFLEDGPSFISYVRRSRPLTYRLGSDRSWNDLYDGLLDTPASRGVDGGLRRIVGVVGTEDELFALDQLTSRFDSLVRAHVNPVATTSLEVVTGGGHSTDSLYEFGAAAIVDTFLARASKTL